MKHLNQYKLFFSILVKFESTLDEYLYDKQRDTAVVKEQLKTERGYGLMSFFKSKI